MPTIIDALVMTLGLDNSQFKRGQAESIETSKKTTAELDKQAKEIEVAQKKALDSFNKVADAALRFFGILTAGRGVIDFTRDSIDMAASLERLAENTGTSASVISAWGRSVEIAGGTQEGFHHTLLNISNMFTDLRTKGVSDLVPFFQVLGVHIADTNGKARSFQDILLDTAKAVQGMNRPDAFNLLTGAGKMDAGTANLVLKGPDAIRAMIAEQMKQGAVTDEQAKRAEQLRQVWVRIGQTLDSVGQRILQAVTPALEKVFDLLQQGVNWLSEHEDVAKALFVGLAVAIAAAAVPLLALAAPLAGIAAQVALVAAAFAGLQAGLEAWFARSPAMAKAWSNLWTGAFNAVKAVWGLLVAVFTGNSVDITNAWRKAADAFKALFGDAINYVKTLWKDFTGAITSVVDGNGPIAKWFKSRLSAIMGTDGASAPSAPATQTAPSSTAPGNGSTADMFAANERANGLPAGLQDAQWLQESSRGRKMLSPAGARGHFGFMAATAAEYGLSNPDDLTSSANAAARKMGRLMKYYGGSVGKALAAYNWGEGNLNKDISAHGDNWMQFAPRETRDYVNQIQGRIGLAGTQAGTGGNVTNNHTITVGEINVSSTSADPREVAHETRRAIISQSDSGMR